MRGFLKTNNIKAISFDLDDTLYDNQPVINKAYQALYKHLIQNFNKVIDTFSFEQFLQFGLTVKRDNPEIVDLNQLRKIHIEQLLLNSGHSFTKQVIEQAFDLFWQQRQKVTFFTDALEVLSVLAQQRPLIAISNGNACISGLGIDQYFQFSVSPSKTTKAKPSPEMFQLSCEKLKIQPKQLLHIGDSLQTDILGANRAGCPSIWFNSHRLETTNSEAKLQPSAQIQSLNQLPQLLCD